MTPAICHLLLILWAGTGRQPMSLCLWRDSASHGWNGEALSDATIPWGERPQLATHKTKPVLPDRKEDPYTMKEAIIWKYLKTCSIQTFQSPWAALKQFEADWTNLKQLAFQGNVSRTNKSIQETSNTSLSERSSSNICITTFYIILNQSKSYIFIYNQITSKAKRYIMMN